MSEQTIGTTCVQGGYHPGDAEPRQVPIYQSTTWKYDTSEHMGKLFDLEESGYFYSRLQNPTCDLVAAKICEMEGGTAAMLTSSGMAANFLAIFNVVGAGDHVVASSAIYGGTYNLLAHTMERMGLTCTFVAPDCTDEELEANDRLPVEMRAKQIGSDKYKMTSWPGYERLSQISKDKWGKAFTAEWMCEAHGPSVFKAILTGDPYQVRALFVSGSNPLSSYGDAKMTFEACKQVEFLVVLEYFMTPTALMADFVLPVAGAMERPMVHTNYGVTDSIVCSERAIWPMYERKTDYNIWKDLGLACGQVERDGLPVV